jgi:hypothetical protein
MYWLVVGGWWLVVGGWWLVVGGWWVLSRMGLGVWGGSHSLEKSHSPKHSILTNTIPANAETTNNNQPINQPTNQSHVCRMNTTNTNNTTNTTHNTTLSSYEQLMLTPKRQRTSMTQQTPPPPHPAPFAPRAPRKTLIESAFLRRVRRELNTRYEEYAHDDDYGVVLEMLYDELIVRLRDRHGADAEDPDTIFSLITIEHAMNSVQELLSGVPVEPTVQEAQTINDLMRAKKKLDWMYRTMKLANELHAADIDSVEDLDPFEVLERVRGRLS